MTEQADARLQEDLDRIEAAVREGATDLRALGFWPIVARIKRAPSPGRWAEPVGRIDRLAFEGRTRLRLPVWAGNAVLLVETLVAAALIPVALALAEGRPPRPALAGILLLASAGALAVGVHGPTHWVTGRLRGIAFVAWFLKGPFLAPGLKVDYASYLRAEPRARAAMHASGALATKTAPFVVFGAAYWRHARAGWELLPEWSLWGLLGMGALMIFTDVVFSTKRSDWKKVRRERRVARDRETAGGIMGPESRPGSSGQPG